MELGDRKVKESFVLKRQLAELKESLSQSESNKLQLQASYDKALQTLADSEAKRETAEKELKIAQDQMASMWKELEMLHKRLNGSSIVNTSSGQGTPSPATNTSLNTVALNEGSLELHCTLCREKIGSDTARPAASPPNNHTPLSHQHAAPTKTPSSSKLWPFTRKQRLNQLDEHSKVCSSKVPKAKPTIQSSSHSPSPSPSRTLKPSSSTLHSSRGTSPKLQGKNKQHLSQINAEERSSLTVNVTRTPTSESDLAPFKVVTRTTMPQFQREFYEVYRGAGDLQWLHDVLVETCPERIVPPLRSTISLDATVSEYQRFLYRLSCHRFLRTEQYFITFLTGSVEELRGLRAKFRPRLPSEDGYMFRPAQGRDTTTGALVATKDYLEGLEGSINGLVQRLQHSHTDEEGSMSQWFWSIARGEPSDTYIKIASTDLARTCEAIESHRAGSDGDDTLYIQNLQSIADYIHCAQDLLLRVEQAVDKFLFWDEEVTICEAVTLSPAASTESGPIISQVDEVYDDSGVSSISDGSANSAGDKGGSPLLERRKMGEDSISEKWAQASSNCADAKEYLEMMCRDLSEELALFDLRKEQELKQVFLDLAGSQLEKNEKLQGKWYAMKCILDFPISDSHRAIQFVSSSTEHDNHTTTRR